MREFLLKARYNPETKEVSIKTVDIEGQKHRYVVQVKPTTSWHNWVVKYHARDQIDVLEFMHAFLKHNVDSTQLKCQLALQAAAENKKNHISILNAIRIVDPTFWVPWINMRSRWQRDLMQEIVTTHARSAIIGCNDLDRLDRFFQFLFDL